ncbi:MAG: chemotaxis protein methyltransferase CheR [bacterium]|jgi:chemotaxis protein methyltransferase CheR
MSSFFKSLTNKEFNQLSSYIYNEVGIKLPIAKKGMLESRLQKRLRKLDLDTFPLYIDYLFSSDGMQVEKIHFIDLVTTNKTDFFRESAHFDFLQGKLLPLLYRQPSPPSPFKVWSAGCSTGEEPYTLAIVLNEFARNNPNIHFTSQILATDISTEVLSIAKKAIYPHEKIAPISMELRKRYLLKSKESSKELVRFAPELRKLILFKRLNFMDSDYGIADKLDVIFCRNVIIYFDRETQERILGHLCRHLKVGGYLFVGHSESLFGMSLPLQSIVPTIYQKIR